jgi:hypothetical protein
MPTSQSWGAAWSAAGVLLCIGGSHWHDVAGESFAGNSHFRRENDGVWPLLTGCAETEIPLLVCVCVQKRITSITACSK